MRNLWRDGLRKTCRLSDQRKLYGAFFSLRRCRSADSDQGSGADYRGCAARYDFAQWRLRAAQAAESSSQRRRRDLRHGAEYLRRRFGELWRDWRASGAASKGDRRQHAEAAAVQSRPDRVGADLRFRHGFAARLSWRIGRGILPASPICARRRRVWPGSICSRARTRGESEFMARASRLGRRLPGLCEMRKIESAKVYSPTRGASRRIRQKDQRQDRCHGESRWTRRSWPRRMSTLFFA